MSTDFAMPDLGEGLTESELVAWHVSVGELVELNQPIAEVETAKAIVQLPSPFAGTISELYVEPGATVAVGSRLVAFELTDEADAPVERNSVLVGYGPTVDSGNKPKRKARGSAGAVSITPPSPTVIEPPATQIRTTPPVRKLAHDLGVDLATIIPTGDDGLITRADVQTAASISTPTVEAQPVARGSRPRETRTPIKGMRKATAEAMVRSVTDAPQATVFVTIDVTATVDLVAQLRERTGQKITILAMIAKAVCLSIPNHPAINSRWDDAAQEIVEFGYVNLGIAVATPRGLMVPNIPDADTLNLLQLTTALATLAETARAGTTTPKALSGGTISITNVGVFGVDAGTPILNPGEAAILAFGVARRRPWEYRNEIALRDVLTLSLTFDHRLIDGEQGAKFLVDVAAVLSNPGIAMTLV
ncbi:MAG TPA: dihydrolipoamide acetyltransferase family protein [Galbitalea sp.]|jgi:pyruvate dehydrogenase E2 component (dihydrolipoamide acetyltransferase)|nr:dihydrolipoamide acetyltransferase family protein [Galbitalea sp.]